MVTSEAYLKGKHTDCVYRVATLAKRQWNAFVRVTYEWEVLVLISGREGTLGCLLH